MGIHTDKIKQAVDIICEQNNLKQPVTNSSAGRLIMEYNGVDYAIEIFENAYIENREAPDKDDPFAFASYKAVLETILLPNKKNMKNANYIEVAERLYKYINPTSKMDCPNSVYITTEKWYYEWLNIETDLDLFDWCVKFKKK